MTENYSMKLPEKFYCGFQQRNGQDDLPLGFMTPWGTDKAFEKRKDTVDRWAGNSYGRTASLSAVTFDNTPVMGFKLGRAIRRCGWNGGNTVIRVEDPRGFEVEIQVGNLLRIMENNTVENGEIMAECVWGRDGNANILLATNSEPYLQAVENTERMKRKTSVKDVKPGMKVRLQNGTEAIWLGMFYGIKFGKKAYPTTAEKHDPYNRSETKQFYEEDGTALIQDDKKKAFFVIDKDTHRGSGGNQQTLEVASAAKIADIIDDSTAMTEAEAEAFANRLLNRSNREFWYYYNGASDYCAVSSKKTTLSFSLVDVTQEEIEDRIPADGYGCSKRYLYNVDGDKTYALGFDSWYDRYHNNREHPNMRKCEVLYGERVLNGETIPHHNLTSSGGYYRSQNWGSVVALRPYLEINWKVLEFTYTGAGTHTIRVW